MADRAGRIAATRTAILAAAERLFAEHGVVAVSNRQISQAAAQGNTAAVGYHFGTKADLVRAIVRRHNAPIDELRERELTATAGATDVRSWTACLVRPVTEHLTALGPPTWYMRFGAQVLADPAFHDIMIEEALASPTLLRVLDGLNGVLPDLPAEVRAERSDLTRLMMVHACAERERALADGVPTPRATWRDAAVGLIDALAGLWLAPATPPAAVLREGK